MSQEAPPWYASLPAPRSAPPVIKPDVLLRILTFAGDFHNGGPLIVDVRRTDYEGGAIAGSINMPAQSFWLNRAVLYKICREMSLDRIIFYCGSSNGRGPRCAGWFADYVADVAKEQGEPETPEVFTLEGGIKGWANAGPEYQHFIKGYDAEYWKQFFTSDSQSKDENRTKAEGAKTEGIAEEPASKRRKESV